MSRATLVIEAEIKSGTLITSKHAGDFSRDVLAVPGSIFSRQSDGPHMLIRSGATPITSLDDLREALGFERAPKTLPIAERTDLTPDESRLARIIESEPITRDRAFQIFGGDIADFNITISMLELKGAVRESEGRLRIS